MAQSTEDYLDSLLRQAMGIEEPKPEKKPEPDTSDMARDDVFAMAEGLTGSNSAILGNAYDHNASFTNQGEIEIPAPYVQTAVESASAQEAEAPVIAPENMPDPDAPVAISSEPVAEPVASEPVFSEADLIGESLLPDIEEETPLTDEISVAEEASEENIDIIPFDNLEAMSIPDSPIIEHDESNLDIIPGPGLDDIPLNDIDILNTAEPVIEETAPILDEPIIEEAAPIPDEPVIEEAAPILDEPVIEEAAPILEEPIIEEAAPILDEPIIEEAAPILEEPVADEPVAEEPVIEEPIAEEPAAPSISIDDLDPNDNAKALDADMIAALFASANAADSAPAEDEPAEDEPAGDTPVDDTPVEETAVEETPTEDIPVADDLTVSDDDASLEELEIPMDDLEEPLMPDQEISDLLSTLGELSGENPAEEETQQSTEDEVSAEESLEDISTEASSEEASTDEPVADLDGLDLFDTDLSAMLDEVAGSVAAEGESASEGGTGEDADLNDLLGSFNDETGDLSDIGDLLEKDENSELVDPNTETAEALFASDSEEELFNIDNLIEEEEPKRKKKKKKFSLFGKKKKDDANIEVIGGEEEMLIDPDLLDIPDESELKKKKPGFFAKFFAKLFEEVDEGAGEESEFINIDQGAVEIAQEGAAENEAILAELDSEEGADKKKKKEKKKKEKKEKKDKKAEAAEGEEGEEGAEAPKKKKKEKKKKEKLPEIPGKRLPRKKVVAISLFCITIGIVITILAFFIPYSQDMEKAKKFYSTGEYQKTYEYMRGHKLTSDDQELYDRTVTLLRIKRPYDSYLNYMKMGLRIEALNALVQGVQMSDKYAETAASQGIIDKYSKLVRQITDELYNSFGVTADTARSWIELEGTPEYTRALYECLVGTSGITTSEPDDEMPQMPAYEEDEDGVIHAEENNL